jgi:TonB family protein
MPMFGQQSLARQSQHYPCSLMRELHLGKLSLIGYFILGFIIRSAEPAIAFQTTARQSSVAVLDFGDSATARRSADTLINALLESAATQAIRIIDRDLGRVAARGVGYSGSLNLSVEEARDLGAAIGCDFYILGDSQTIRRSPSAGPIYFESYASLFLVSARTGRLIAWERPSFEAATPEASENRLLHQLASAETRQRYFNAIRRAREDERRERETAVEHSIPVIEAADEAVAEAQGLRLPRPYRRLKPAYPDTAARADAEGTVDVLVDLDKAGEVNHVEIARWAGFGLDEATVNTVSQLHFFPAMRDGVSIPIRVLLRYNFRRPAK